MIYDGKTPWSEWYEAYLKSSEWAARRGAVIARAGGLCEGCRSAIATQVHHRPEAYKQLRAVGRELLCDLVALCDTCHSEVAHWDKRSDEELAKAPTKDERSDDELLITALVLHDVTLRSVEGFSSAVALIRDGGLRGAAVGRMPVVLSAGALEDIGKLHCESTLFNVHGTSPYFCVIAGYLEMTPAPRQVRAAALAEACERLLKHRYSAEAA